TLVTRTAIRQPGTTTDLRGGLRRDAGLSGPAHPTRRRDHRDGRRQRVHPGGAPVGLHSWDRDVDGVRVGRRGRRLAPVDWTQHRRLRRVGALRILLGRLPQPGRVTKTGNGHARRLLVEAAWHHRSPYRPSRDLRGRWTAASPAAQARGHAANTRLHNRWAGFDKRKKRSVVANAAIARELAGWCWSLAVLDDV